MKYKLKPIREEGLVFFVCKMDVNSVQKPLLSTQSVEPAGYDAKKTTLTVFLAKWFLKSLMWMVFILWAGFIFLYPAKSVTELFRKFTRTTNETIFGITGLLLMLNNFILFNFVFCFS